LFIIYRASALQDVCETQLNRMRICEPQSIEKVVSRAGDIVRTDRDNYYVLSGKHATIVEVSDGCGSERDTRCSQNDGRH